MNSFTNLLITGEMRSGTTLVANFLNEQTNITIFRDFLHIDTLKSRVGIKSFKKTLSFLEKKQIIEKFNQDTDQLGISLTLYPEKFDSLFQFYEYILKLIAKPSDVIVGHKITLAHGLIKEFLNYYPDMKIIYVMRDPRDVIVSARKIFNHISLFQLIYNWQTSNAYLNKCIQDLRINRRLFIIKYEDFVKNTQESLLKLNRFLDSDTIAIPDSIHDYGESGFNNSSFELKESSNVIRKDSVGSWMKRDMVSGKIVSTLLFKALKKEGYTIICKTHFYEKIKILIKFQFFKLYKILRSIFLKVKYVIKHS